jgi:hypothetical protein
VRPDLADEPQTNDQKPDRRCRRRGAPGGDVEGDLDVGGGGLLREADGVIEENLVSSGLDDQGRQAGQVGKYGLMRPRAAFCPAV